MAQLFTIKSTQPNRLDLNPPTDKHRFAVQVGAQCPAVPKMDISADGPSTAATVSFKISCDASALVTQAVTAECG
jgi:hypothetical protein